MIKQLQYSYDLSRWNTDMRIPHFVSFLNNITIKTDYSKPLVINRLLKADVYHLFQHFSAVLNLINLDIKYL